ncbi:hypothetical protein FRC12_001626 [Ceratobasidium sp. 428]|nr:hypothetical protein FRC12_001626 [Ceratobasidium sp. 428]
MQNQAQKSTRIRLRIKALEVVLKAASKYPINLKLLSDGGFLCNTNAIDKNQALRWEDLNPIDGNMSGSLEIRVYELHWHGKKRERIGSVSLQVSEIVNSQLGITIHGVPTSSLSSVSVVLESAGESYNEAQKAQGLAMTVVNMSPKLLDSLRQTQGTVDTILNVSQNIPEIMQVGSVVEACKKACEVLRERTHCDVLVAKLVSEMGDVLQHVGVIENHAKIAKLRDTIKELLLLVEDASQFVIEYKSDGAAVRTVRAFASSNAQDQVDKFTDRFRSLKKNFNLGMTTQVIQRVEKLLDDADRALLEKLVVSGASYDLSRRCLDGTRVEILEDIRDWALGTTGLAPLFWLYGPAGCGKSSIATSTSNSLHKASALAGSFFCKRDNEHLRKPENVISHLAASLAYKCLAYGEKLLEALRKDPTLAHSPTRTRFVGLMVEPLAALGTCFSCNNLVLVVDAIDESGSAEHRTELVECLLELPRLVKWLKVLVTSRPNEEIRALLGLGEEPTEQRNLFAVDEASVSRDIKAYIQSRMNAIAIDAADRGQWPDDQHIDRLRTASNKLFIWARTACNLIQQSFDPEATLKQILDGQRSSDEKKALGLIYTTALNEGLGEARNDTKIVQLCVGAIVLTGSRRPLPDTALAVMLSKRMKPSVLSRVINRLGSVLYRDDQSAVRVLHQSFSDYIAEMDCPEHYRIDPVALNAELTASCLEVMLRDLRFNICKLEDSCVMNCDVIDLQTRIETNVPPELMYSCAYWTTHLVVSPFTELLEGLLTKFLNGPHLLYWIEVLSLTDDLRAATEGMVLMMKWGDNSHASKYTKIAVEVYSFIFAVWEAVSISTPHLYVSAFPFGAANYTAIAALKPYFPSVLSVTGGTNLWNTPCLRTFTTQGKINSISISSDGRHIVSGTQDGTVQIRDTRTGKTLCSIVRGSVQGSVHDLSQSLLPDRGRLRDPSQDQLHTGGRASPMETYAAAITSVAFSPDGQHIVFGSTDCAVRVWDTQAPCRMSVRRLRGHSDCVTSVAFSPDGQRIASGSKDRTVRLWDVSSDRKFLPHTLRGHQRRSTSVAFSPDGRWVISGSRDKTIRIWDAQTGKHLETLEKHSNWVTCVAFSSDGQRIISGSVDTTVLVWDTNAFVERDASPRGQVVGARSDKKETSGVLLGPLFGHSESVTCVAFSLDGQRLISSSEDKTVRVWDACTGAKLLDPFHGHTDWVMAISCDTSDGRHIISGSRDQTIRVWDIYVDTGPMIHDQWYLEGHSDIVTAVAFSSDGRRLASGSRDGTIRIWDAYTGASLAEPLHYSNQVTFIAFAFDDKRIACGSRASHEQVWVWDIQTGDRISNSSHGQPSNWVTAISLNISCHIDTSIDLPELDGGMCRNLTISDHVFTPKSHFNLSPAEEDRRSIIYKLTPGINLGWQDSVSCVAFSPNGMFLLSAGDSSNTTTFWMDKQRGECIGAKSFRNTQRRYWSGPERSEAVSLAFSPDSRCVFLGWPNGVIEIHKSSGALHFRQEHEPGRVKLQVYADVVTSVAFSPDGQRVATGSLDQTVRIWDIQPPLQNDVRVFSGDLSSLLREDWVCNQSGDRLFWLPPAYQGQNIERSLVIISAKPQIQPAVLDLSRLKVGTDWVNTVNPPSPA